nr:NADH dehydrogenase subunit 5 [Scolopendra subspinipes]
MDYSKVFSYYLMIVSVMLFFVGVYFLYLGVGYYFDWVFVDYLSCTFSLNFVFDWVSMFFTSFVMFISSCVMYYSINYMEEDKSKNRFSILVFLFVVSMVLLINSTNLISLLLGWDGLGLISYCLVIYYQNLRSYNAGMITIMSNRVGDAALLMSICWMFVYGDWGYNFIYGKDLNMCFVVLFFCIFAAMTKSAQIPFSAWLPAAMAAPTPVSALVHSSTLVTAGVYLMIRFGGMFLFCGYLYKILLIISVLTMFMAGISANYENDLKKIIALSTLSQLGLMMFILSTGYERLAYFHLLTHAMFKALLFLCAGCYIHSFGDSQDIRKMGAMIYSTPFISMSLMLSSFALLGFPYLAGFYSKDFIIEMYSQSGFGMLIYVLLMVSVGLTSCYSMRLGYYVLWGPNKMSVYIMVKDCGIIMLMPMFLLSLMAIMSGSMMMWLMFPIPSFVCVGHVMKISTLFFVFFGLWIGLMIWWGYNYGKSLVKSFMGSMWFMVNLSGEFVSKGSLILGYKSMMGGDMGWVEYINSVGINNKLSYYGLISQWWQNNSLKTYLFVFFISVILMLLY